MFRGSVGGWGGLGGLPPQRTSMPNSQTVESTDEFNKGWQDRLGTVPQYISVAYQGMSDPVTTMDNVDRYQSGNIVPFAGEYGRKHHSVGAPGVQDITYPTDPGMDPGMVTKYRQEINPEWSRLDNMRQDATNQRTENQTRQQQAYDFGMMGGNAKNGLLNQDYSQAGYGQISGQPQSGAFGADGGTQLGGVDNSFISGAYNPSNSGAVYNPNPFSAQNYDPTGWGL
jgi:hypothetical protein